MRDHYAATLDEDAAEEYEDAFNRAVRSAAALRARDREPLRLARIEDYALDRRPPDGGARRPRRVDRLALLPALRLRRLLRRAARHDRARPLARSRRATTAGRAAAATGRDTLVLETECETDDGRGARHRLHAAARRGARHRAHRRGPARQVRDALRARDPLRLRLHRALGASTSTTRASRSRAPTRSCFRTPVEHSRRGHAHDLGVRRREGERVPFVLTWYPSHEDPPDADRRRARARGHRELLATTGRARCGRYTGEWRDVVAPLADHAEGAHLRADRRDRRRADDVAARVDRRRAQLGLPLLLAARRDAHAARAAQRAATPTRRAHWRDGCCARSPAIPPTLQIMYGVAGERRLTELELDWLPGYEGSRPVRIGNAASEQLQLDVYGEVMDALYQAREHGLGASSRRLGAAAGPARLPRATPGASPTRGSGRCAAPRRHFTHSKVMAWVAFDRGVRRSRARPRRAGRALARDARRDPPRGLQRGLRRRARARSRSPTARRSSTRACC